MANWWENDAVIVGTPSSPQRGEWWEADEVVAQPQAQDDRPGGMAFMNRSIADTLGAPVDMINAGLDFVGVPVSDEPFLGSASLARGMDAINADVAPVGEDPETFSEFVGRGTGGAAAMLVPFGAAARGMSAAGGLTGALGQSLSQPFISTPARAVAAELMSGAGAGAGEAVAEGLAPDSAGARVAGALLGGVAGGMGPYAIGRGVQAMPVVGTAARVIQGEIAPFTQAGAMQRARNRVSGLVEDAPAASAALDEPTIGNLSPAVQTGDRRLMALEKKVRDTDPVTDLIMRGLEIESGELLRDAVRAPAQGADSFVARDFVQDRISQGVDSIGQTLDNAFGAPIGTQRVSTALREQSAPARQQAYDEAYAQPIDFSTDAGRNLEGLIGRVERAAPGTIAMANRLIAGDPDAANVQQIMASIGDDGTVTYRSMPTTQQVDYITRALNQMARSGEGQGALGGQTDIGRVMGNLSTSIRSALKEANPAYATALETAATPIGQRQALLFGQGLLSPNVPRDLAQEQIAGMTQPELAFVRQGVRSQIDEMLANVRASMSNPDVGYGQAQQALRQLSAPAVREKISLILPEDAAQDLFSRIDNAANLLDPKRSGVALFAGARPQEEIRSIINAPDPSQAAAQLVNEAQGNPEALAGLKGAFIDELMQRARTNNFDESGEAIISGRALSSQLGNNRVLGVANQLLSMEERSRLSKVIDEFTRIETSQTRLPDVGGVMEGEPNSIVSLVARTIAARQGARMGQGTSGASLLTANFASQRMTRILQGLTLDKAEALIRRAITGDRELFQALLTPGTQMTKQQENRVIETIIGLTGATAQGAGEPAQKVSQRLSHP